MKEVIGTIDIEELKTRKEVWRRNYCTLKIALNEQNYLLDHYVHLLLQSCSDILCHRKSEYGLYETGKFLTVCGKIVERNEDESTKDYYFYQQIKDYIATHPLPYLESRTQSYIYFNRLLYDWLEVALQYYEHQQKSIFRDFDTPYFNALHKQIQGLIQKPERLDEFKNLTLECFHFVDSNKWLLESIFSIVQDCLMHKDIETGDYIFSLL